MLDCGLRLSEITHLKMHNINFDKKYIKVYGKGRKERLVPIGEKVCKALCRYLTQREEYGFFTDYFFLSSKGERIYSTCVVRLFYKLKNETGIERVHAHLLRHTYATNFLLYDLGDVYELSMLLGHNDIKTTEIYINISNYYKILEKRQKNRSYMDTLKL